MLASKQQQSTKVPTNFGFGGGKMDFSSTPNTKPHAHHHKGKKGDHVDHRELYKSRGRNIRSAGRRRREEELSLRKTKKEAHLAKRRNIDINGLMALNPEDLDDYWILMNSDEEGEILQGVQQFRKLLSIDRNPPIAAVIDRGCVELMIKLGNTTSNETIRFEAFWALTNVASGTSEQTQYVVDAGITPLIVKSLSSPNAEVREQAIWAMGNIAGDCTRLRDFLFDEGGLQPVINVLQNKEEKISMLRNATWVLSNLMRGKPGPDMAKIKKALPVLKDILALEDQEIIVDALWAVSYLTDGDNSRIQSVLSSGIVNFRLLQLLGHISSAILTPCLRATGNIATGDDSQTQHVLNLGLLPLLKELLNHQKTSIRKEACWTVSNITAGTSLQIQAVIDMENMFPKIVSMALNDEFNVKKEATWAISNATSGGTKAQIYYLVDEFDIFQPLCSMLTASDAKVMNVALEAIENILKATDGDKRKQYIEILDADPTFGREKVESLQTHHNAMIANTATNIMELMEEQMMMSCELKWRK